MRAELRGHDGAAATSRRWFRFENRNPKTRKSPGDACMCVICWHRPLALTRATANKHMKKKGNVFEEMEAKENTGQFPEWKRKFADQVENGAVMMVMMVITIWALFGDDIKYLTTDTSSQPAFEGITIFCLVFEGFKKTTL